MKKMHKVVIEITDKNTKKIIETRTEDFYSIYNAEKRVFELTDTALTPVKGGTKIFAYVEKFAA